MSAFDKIVIDRRSSKDYSVQIYEKIKKSILLYEFSDDILDYEKLSESLNVDVSVVLKAFEFLVVEGVFIKCEKGSYCNVYREVLTYTEKYDSSLLKHIKDQGLELSVELLERKEFVVDKIMSTNLAFEIGQKLIHQTRVYYGDNYPKAYVKLYFDQQYRGQFNDLNKGLLDTLNFKDSNLKIKRILKSVIVPNKICHYLNQPKKTAGVVLNEYVYDSDKIHYLAIFYFTPFFTLSSYK